CQQQLECHIPWRHWRPSPDQSISSSGGSVSPHKCTLSRAGSASESPLSIPSLKNRCRYCISHSSSSKDQTCSRTTLPNKARDHSLGSRRSKQRKPQPSLSQMPARVHPLQAPRSAPPTPERSDCPNANK